MIMPLFKRSSPWTFFALAYGASWLFWIPAALWGQAEPAPLTLLLHYLGGLMPPLVAIALTVLGRNPEVQRDYWQRILDFKRVRVRWYVVILLIVPLLTGLGAVLDVLLGGSGGQLAARFVGQPLAVVPFALFTLLFGPLPEEIAWRGYGLDRLQVRWNALASSLIVGVAWTLWHLPLFFIAGSYQHGLLGSLSFWLFMADKIPQSIVMAWVYNNNRRSTLTAVLVHFMVNFVGELLDLTQRAEFNVILLWVVVAIAVTVLWGPKTLTREGEG